jgi:hypothetical protein
MITKISANGSSDINMLLVSPPAQPGQTQGNQHFEQSS